MDIFNSERKWSTRFFTMWLCVFSTDIKILETILPTQLFLLETMNHHSSHKNRKVIYLIIDISSFIFLSNRDSVSIGYEVVSGNN